MKNKVIQKMLILVIICVLIDQGSKMLVSHFITTPVGNSFLKIEVANNTGMAFGFHDGNVKNIFLTICVLVLIINFIRKQLERMDKRTSIVLSVIIAGGISNLIDRIFRGSVLDFIKIYQFPIFNIADIYVVVGWILLVIFLIQYSRK